MDMLASLCPVRLSATRLHREVHFLRECEGGGGKMLK